jgi:structural maintenance of chromosomes protein 6
LATEEVAKYEAEHQELGEIDHLTEKKEDLQAKMKVNKAKLTEIKVHHIAGFLISCQI